MNTTSPSAFKYVYTKSRYIKRVENALLKSPHKWIEAVSSIAMKCKLRINLVKNSGGRLRKDLSDEQKQWLRNVLDRSDLSIVNPGKKDHVYIGKSNGERKYEQKRYLLWPLRDLLNILNTPENDSYIDTYGEELPFSVLCRFLKEHKQYIFNKNIPHNVCLCEICKSAVLLSKAVPSIAPAKIPTDPHTIVEHYSCESYLSDCIQSRCDECKNHGLDRADFESPSDSSNSDNGEDEREKTIKFQEWKRDDNGFMMKSHVSLSLEDGLELWNSRMQRLKEHIFAKRQQQSKISHLKTNLKSTEILLHVDYSQSHKSKEQNEIQSAYFGQSPFSFFTACPYYRCLELGKVKAMPTTVTSEAIDKSL